LRDRRDWYRAATDSLVCALQEMTMVGRGDVSVFSKRDWLPLSARGAPAELAAAS
jgi:hypothetical protein